jgi:hypothetical protein
MLTQEGRILDKHILTQEDGVLEKLKLPQLIKK